ncbi:MAG: ATP-binding protein [Chloroflexota bacterium]
MTLAKTISEIHTEFNENDSLVELRRQLASRLANVMVGFGILSAWYFLLRRDIPMTASLLACFLIVIGRGVQQTLEKRSTLAFHLLVVGSLSDLIIAMILFPNPYLPFFGLLFVFVSAMLVRGGGFATALIIIGTAALLNVTTASQYPLFEIATLLTLAAISSWLSANTLFTAIHWYRIMELRSTQLLEVTRDHRAQLSQTLKSLEIAYETQKRTQLDLIWARKQAENARRLKEQFAANISHELRTPLNLILGFSEIMYRSPEVYGDMAWAPTLRRDVHQIYRSSQHLLAMIEDILDLSRFEIADFSLNFEQVDLEPLLHETFEIAQNLVRGRPVYLQINVAPNLPKVDLDCTRIRQVVLNLLNNACSFTEVGTVDLVARQSGRDVLISVIDTGAGIPKDKLGLVFDDFYQADHSLRRSHGGAGLGLAISKRFVESHRGRIWVESEVGVGSAFTFSLPISDHALLKTQADPTPLETNPEHVRPALLVIERNAAVVAMLRRRFLNCEVIQVRESDSVEEMILQYNPKVIIDSTNANPIPQRSTVERSVPVIYCRLPEPSLNMESLGVAGYLTKPVWAQELLDQIGRLDNVRDILLVDDDRGFVLLMEQILLTCKCGYSVRRAYGGREGFEAMKRQLPDLVVLDVALPDLDGISLLAKMRDDATLNPIPVLLLASEEHSEDIETQEPLVITGLTQSETIKGLVSIVNEISVRYPDIRDVYSGYMLTANPSNGQ